MLKFFKSFFKKTAEPVVPYKVETPAPAPATVIELAPAPVVEAMVSSIAPAKKKPAAKKAPAVKKPRAPRKPK
jgi:hypothetical protein